MTKQAESVWVSQAAGMLGVTRQAVDKLVKSGRLEGHKEPYPANARGFVWRVSVASIKAWKRKRGQAKPKGSRTAD